MDTPIRDVTQVSLDQILAYQKVLQKEPSQTSGTDSALGTDEASVIRRAGELAREILQTEQTPEVSVDWTQIDSEESARTAAESIVKYGV
jgi:hypothetical protein